MPNLGGFADYAEAWATGFNACRDGTPAEDGKAVMARLMNDFHMSGSQLAKRSFDGELDEKDRERLTVLEPYRL